MARRVFFSFDYENDLYRANVVKNGWVTKDRVATGFVDPAEFEELKKGGDDAIKKWINDQLRNTSVMVVLVGQKTCSNRWVKYGIQKSIEDGKGLLGIDISKIKDPDGYTTSRCGEIPKGYNFFLWNKDNGNKNLGEWIEAAAIDAGR